MAGAHRFDASRYSLRPRASLPALEKAGFPNVARLPYSLKILLENLLRREDNGFVKTADIRVSAYRCRPTDTSVGLLAVGPLAVDTLEVHA